MKSIVVSLMALLSISCTSHKETVNITEKTTYLYKVNVDSKWGFIDSMGNIKIKPRFNNVRYYNEGLAPVSIGGVETIDTLNKIDGRLIGEYWNIVKLMKGEKWGYIDTTGNFIIKPTYDDAFEFSNGSAPVRVDKLYGYIDTTGKFILPLQYEGALPFYGEYAAVSYPTSDSTFFIDRTGQKKLVSPGKITVGFIDGFALVGNYYDNGPKSGYIDKKGYYVVKPIYDVLHIYHDGLALFGIKADRISKFGFLDIHGKIKIQASFSFATDFGDSVAWVVKDKELYIIDIDGRMLKTNKYKNVQSFSEGVSAIKLNGKWGYCDKQGNITIQPQFDNVEQFENGLAAVINGNVSGYINKNGKLIWSQSIK